MNIPTSTVVPVPDGLHEGIIISVEDRKGEFDYIDINVHLPALETDVRRSSPAKISKDENGVPKSALAKDLVALGIAILDADGNDIPFSTEILSQGLKGKKVSVTVKNETKNAGTDKEVTFSNVTSISEL